MPNPQAALPSHCITCANCVLGCPFGVPRYIPHLDLMIKYDMCYDRTSVGKRPMCVTVCPSGALAYGPCRRAVSHGTSRHPKHASAADAGLIPSAVPPMLHHVYNFVCLDIIVS
jgi:Fe-S-cluster-containing dehydrogenase component